MDVLCSDKTGTLTEGIMSFVRLVVGGTQRVLEINGGAPDDWQITSQGAAFQPKQHTPGAETDNMLGGFSCIMNQCAASSTYKGGTWESTGSSNFIDIAASRFNASDLGKSLSDKYSEADIAVDHPFQFVLNPVVAAQHFEYKSSNLTDKAMESMFGFITVLPGAFSAYRLCSIEGKPLDAYFKSLRIHNLGAFQGNMYLAEDRILVFELLAKRGCGWTMHYVKVTALSTSLSL